MVKTIPDETRTAEAQTAEAENERWEKIDMEIETIEIEDLLAATEHVADTPTFGKDSESLKRQAEHLHLELQSSMAEGSLEDCIRLKTQLEILPIQIRKAQVEEARAAIGRANEEIIETQTLISDARELRDKRQMIFAEKMRDLENAGTAVEKAKFLLWRLDLEIQNHRAVIRHQESLLRELIEPTAEDKK
jgi:hypothetical protein